mmetsp:Transcript_19103/g.32789  ORF Transcript_19103/g.32789 Transcript_19103/m.32789 type:complete len:278 (-) Transcript_19103:432-1265(-)|eukprot:CAMPEP_0119107704 /NCGR_PEP_ID=MMETSP1180-20130426/11551_1 /TAXON_ID=3052 ORGANISM="Chlamydomonas cf sp, Strain CCMP681" /NCGR_SAMPLE_ID=MMETSP1180 /ASSEMBLY_ACC=CAM_ASM_000741 /LENGTH=277 /DNA_ID=CAMNT_0007093227 /DNA_START=203 /DNA_END=1036 /DNA_ORIENTATION=-
MSLFDLSERANAVLRKYEKYDAAQKQDKDSTGDPFMDEYQEVDAEVDKLMEAAGDVLLEHSRSVIAQKNAEIRRAKQVLLTEAIEALQKKVKKGKGVTKQTIAERENKIKDITDKIYSIPDGMSSQARRPLRYGAGSKTGKGGKDNPIMLDVDGRASSTSQNNPLYYQGTDQTQVFEKEADIARRRQDEQLDRIGNGVTRLGEIAKNMQEEVDRQDPIIDDIEHQMDKVTGQLKNNNAKLKGLVEQMRSSRNFCVDVILIVVILAIGAYVYSIFKPK